MPGTTTSRKRPTPSYRRVKAWVEAYGRIGHDDRRGIADFLDIEAPEAIRSLRAELIALSEGRFDPKAIEQILALKRKAKYGSYENWAKRMLTWIAGNKKR